MDPLTRLTASIDQAQGIVARVPTTSYGSATPCPEWDSGALINHMLTALVMFREAGQKGSVDPSVLMQDHRGSDAAESMRTIGAHTVAAWSAPGKLDEVAHLPIGEFPAAMALQLPAMDLVVHGWDLAKANNLDVTWNEELVDDTRTFVTATFADPNMRGESFAPPVEVPASADTLTQTVAFLGRTP